VSADQHVVVHHHYYYGAAPSALAERPAGRTPQRRAPQPRRSPALYVAGGAGLAVALVVAVTVATALAVVIGLAALLVLGVKHYAALHQPAAAPARRPVRDVRGRFTS